MREFLAEYAAGTLPPERRAEVTAHLAVCGTCRADADAWHSLAVSTEEKPSPRVVRDALLCAALKPLAPLVAPTRRRPLFRLMCTQLRLVPVSTWVVSAVVIAGAVVVAWQGSAGAARPVLALAIPMVAALSLAGTCGRDHDGAAEIVATTLTGKTLVLLARLALVLGAEIGLAMVASGLLKLLGVPHSDFAELVRAWLGPTGLLSGLALLTAAVFGAGPAATAAMVVWLARLAAGGLLGMPVTWLVPLRTVWTTNLGTVAASVVLLTAAALIFGRSEPTRPADATSPT
jgi:anti-sigma factor RsiW